MRDVAERAGVALVTVSRVVNGIGTVREETADRVNAAINAIGYQRNEIARSLRPGQNSMTVGLLLGDLTNPFYASLAKAAVDVANRAGYAVLLSTADEDPEVERRAVGELIGRRVAGLIIVPDQGDHAFLNEINAHDHVPIVFVDRPATGAEADVVVVDNEGGERRRPSTSSTTATAGSRSWSRPRTTPPAADCAVTARPCGAAASPPTTTWSSPCGAAPPTMPRPPPTPC